MAITWYNTVNINGKWTRTNVLETSHEGLVLSDVLTKEVKVGLDSDAYGTRYYVNVWNPDNQAPESITLHTQPYLAVDMPAKGVSVKDASPEVQAAYDNWLFNQNILEEWEKEKRKKVKHQEQLALLRTQAEAKFHTPRRDLIMQVVRGRKVPQGTIGRVFWLDSWRSPSRVGLALNGKKDAKGRFVNVAWVDAGYLENTDPAGPDYEEYGLTPDGSDFKDC